MKSKQLADVLIKILGLSLCVHSIPASLEIAISGIQLLIQAMHNGSEYTVNRFPYFTSPAIYWISAVVEVAIGIYLIVRSRKIAEFLFKNEDE